MHLLKEKINSLPLLSLPIMANSALCSSSLSAWHTAGILFHFRSHLCTIDCFTPRDNESQPGTHREKQLLFPEINISFDFLSPGEILIGETVPFAIGISACARMWGKVGNTPTKESVALQSVTVLAWSCECIRHCSDSMIVDSRHSSAHCIAVGIWPNTWEQDESNGIKCYVGMWQDTIKFFNALQLGLQTQDEWKTIMWAMCMEHNFDCCQCDGLLFFSV